jgi:S-formylglutathione hydrolase FrmB
VQFHAVIPNDVPPMMKENNPHYQRAMKTVYLLHGHSGCDTDWLYNAPLTQLAGQYNMCFITPAAENGFYLDGAACDRKYGKYVGEELVAYTRSLFGLSDKLEDTFVGGLSMGGFGAIHTALAYPDTFGKAMALSSALIIYDIKDMKPGTRNEIADYDYYHMVFGDLATVDKSDNNPEQLVVKNQTEGKRIPPIYMAVGTEDFLYQNNQIFRKFLEEHHVDFKYTEGPGQHDFVFWNEHLPKALAWFLE